MSDDLDWLKEQFVARMVTSCKTCKRPWPLDEHIIQIIRESAHDEDWALAAARIQIMFNKCEFPEGSDDE